jgi:Tfp pilus assembly protein PilO
MTLWRRIFAERRSVLVPLIVLLIIDAALLLAVVLPLKKVVASDTAAAEAAKFASAVATQRLMQMKNARTSRDRAEKELAKFYGEVLPVSDFAANRVLNVEIARLARENNLVLGNRDWQPEPVKDSPLRRVTMKVDLVGDYGSVLHFIYDVETSEAFMAIRSVQLSQTTQQRAASGQLQLALEIATYYRSEPAAK